MLFMPYRTRRSLRSVQWLADFINLQLEKSCWTAFRYKPTRVLRVR
jgi:hypothetical protein